MASRYTGMNNGITTRLKLPSSSQDTFRAWHHFIYSLAMNPFAEANLISGTILQANMIAICCRDYDGKTPLDYARQYNVPGMLAMIEALCMNQWWEWWQLSKYPARPVQTKTMTMTMTITCMPKQTTLSMSILYMNTFVYIYNFKSVFTNTWQRYIHPLIPI